MMIDNRSYTITAGDYRHRFNGQEKDDEVSGSGNSYTAMYWQYDSRLGRRWNLDPKPNPSISPYATFANNPIWHSDRLGDTLKIEGSFGFKLKTRLSLTYAKIFSKEARKIVKQLKKSKNVHTIVQKNGGGNSTKSDSYNIDDSPLGGGARGTGTGKGTGSEIRWDLTSKNGGKDVDGNTKRPKYIGLLHEMFHAYQIDRGEIDRTVSGGVKTSEREASHSENVMRAQINRSPFSRIALRKYYGRVVILKPNWNYKKDKPK